MNDHASDAGTTPWYEIRLQGRLGPQWAARFDGMTLHALDDGTTALVGPVTDQAALHGLLRRLGDLGIPLLSVTQTDPDNSSDPRPST
ncbi:hypothetical protein [Pedococcus bigeumensis]|uniref:hypothetical protein n=1 Tax=Pedococcus bigeumensis TaxID=433644 RepID=UPI0031E1BBE5